MFFGYAIVRRHSHSRAEKPNDGRSQRSKMSSYVQRIREATRQQFSPSFERLADYFLDSYAHAALLTATEIGHSLDIDTATVVRFAQHLGYGGYPELQREIRAKLRRELLDELKTQPNSAAEAVDAALSELAHGLDRTRKSFPHQQAKTLIKDLDVAQRVIVIAEGLAFGPARNLAAWLESAGYNIHLAGGSLSEIARALTGARKGDMLIVIQIDEETPFLSSAIAEAKTAGIRTIALVSSHSSSAAHYADLTLAAHNTLELGADQFIVEALIYAFMRMLYRARPGRFKNTATRLQRIRHFLSREDRQ